MRKRLSIIISVFLILFVAYGSAIAESVLYYADSTAADQGASGTRTIKGLATAIGSTKQATIVLAHTSNSTSTTYTVSTNLTVTSNITLKVERGAVASIDSGKTLNVSGVLDAGTYQVFSGTGTVTLSGNVKEVYPEWFGLSESASGANNITYLGYAVTATPSGGKIKFASGKSYPCSGQWTLSKAVTVDGYGTELTWDSADDAATDQGILVTASNVQILGLKVTGVQDDAYVATQVGIFAYGTYNSGSAPTYITGLKIKDCNITNWSSRGIRMRFVQYFDVSGNYLDNLYYAGIVGESVNYGTIDSNKVNNVAGYVLSGSSKEAYGILVAAWGTYTETESPRSSYVIVSNNHVYNVPNWEGLDTHGGANISFLNNTVRDTYVGLMICGSVDSATAYEGTDNVIAIGNTLTTTLTFSDPLYSRGIVNNPGAATFAAGEYNENTKLIGNTTNGFYYGIYDAFTKGAKIQGNTILGTVATGTDPTHPSAGINLYADNIDIDVSGNTVTNMVADSGDNILFEDNDAEATGIVTGNTLNTTNADYGINVNSTAVRGVRVINNKFTGTPDTANYRYQARTSWDTYINTTAVSTSGTGEDNLMTTGTIYLPATLIMNVKASGVKTDTGTYNKTIKFYYGSSTVTFNPADTDKNDWQFEATIIQTAAAVQKIFWKGISGTSIVAQGYEDWTENTATSTVIKFTGEAAASGAVIKQEMMILERKYQ
jgi:hypothetical protein